MTEREYITEEEGAEHQDDSATRPDAAAQALKKQIQNIALLDRDFYDKVFTFTRRGTYTNDSFCVGRCGFRVFRTSVLKTRSCLYFSHVRPGFDRGC